MKIYTYVDITGRNCYWVETKDPKFLYYSFDKENLISRRTYDSSVVNFPIFRILWEERLEYLPQFVREKISEDISKDAPSSDESDDYAKYKMS